MKKLLLMSVAVGAICAQNATASIFFDVNGTTAGAGLAAGGSYTWEGNFWSTDGNGVAAPSAWDTLTPTLAEAWFPRITNSAITGNFTITVNNNHTIAGALMNGITGNVTIQGPGILTITNGQQGFFGGTGGNMVLHGKLSGPGGIVPQSGQIFLEGTNDFTGGIAVGVGLLNFNNNSALGTGTITVGSAGRALISTVNNLVIPNNFNLTLAQGLNALNLSSTLTGVTTTYGGNWTIPVNIGIGVGGGANNTAILTGVVSGAGGLSRQTQASAGTLILTGVNTFTGPITNLNGVYQIGGAGQLNSGSYAGVIANTGTFVYGSSANQTLSGVISGAGPVVNSGSGTLTLSGVDTFTGGISNATGSTLTIGGAGTVAANVITNNGTINYASTGSSTWSAAISGTGGINKSAAGGLTLSSAANTFTGKVSVTGGTLTINNGDTLGTPPGSPVADQLTLDGGTFANGTGVIVTLSANRGVTLGAGGGTISLNTSATGKSLIIPGVVTGSGALTKIGGQVLTLSGANNYTGKTSIQQGTISASSLNSVTGGTATSSLGAPTTVPNGTISMGAATNAILLYTGAGETTDRVIDLAGTVGLIATIQNDGSGPLNFTSDISVTGNGIKTMTLQGANTGANTFSGKIQDGAAATILAKGGAGTWNITGANTHTGGTVMNSGGGLLNIGNASALGTGPFSTAGNSTFDNTTGAPLTVANVLNLAGGSPTYIGSANDMTINGAVTLSGANRTLTVNARTVTLGGAIGQDVQRGFTKAGAGKLVIGATSSFTGTNNINGGNEQVDGNLTSAALVTVNSGATLSGNGIVSATTVASGGSVNPGASPGTLSVAGALSFNAGGTNVVEINDFSGTSGSNPGWDLINAGSLAINGAMKLKVNSLSGTSTGPAANYSNTSDYDLLILHATNGITAGDTTLITIDSSNFAANNAVAGSFFSVAAVTNIDLSVDLILQVRVAPFVTVAPTTSASVGQTVVISATVTGDGSVTYQWKKGVNNLLDGSTVPAGTATVQGATTTSLTLLGVTYQDEGAYTLVANNLYGTGSGTSTLTVSDPPVITSPTSASTVVRDAGQNFAVSATTTGRPATYQWKRGASNLSNGAFDNAATVSGAQTANLVLTSVRAADAGDYTVSVVNADGSVTSVATTLQVVDPAITQQPVASTFECGTSNALTIAAVGTTNANGVLLYQWYNGDANSSVQLTDQTNTVLTFNPASFANAGSYFAIVTNGLGNSITSSVVVVTIQDNNAPIISMIGGNATLECHVDTFTDAGATAADGCDGAVAVTTNNPVNANATGIYTVTYSATDAHANVANAYRVITVQDTGLPTLNLLGSAELSISCGAPYVDAGATASDVCAGDITGSIIVNYGGLVPATPTAGDYTIVYNVQDPAGNNALAVSRIVHVSDSTAPVVNLIGGAEVTNECHTAFADPGVSAIDACAGNVSNSVQVVSTLDTNTIGVYTLTYVADDGAGNTNSSVTRIVHVTDAVGPVITLNGPSALTIECHGGYTDAGASADDACDGATSPVTTGSVDADTVGVYTLTYTATDVTGNSSSSTRQVSVEDHTAPSVLVTGSNPASAECHVAYSDAGATASDLCTGDLTSQITVDLGGLNTSSPAAGTYTITYSVSDVSSNSASATRTVIVADTAAPIITLNGANPDSACQNLSYTDPGASANDACVGVITPIVSGTVDTNVAGSYTLTYTADDGNGNIATTNRVVTVAPCQIVISEQPHSQALNAGDTLTLSVVAVAPQNGPLTYQWYKGASSLLDETNSVYTKLDVKSTDATNYHVTLVSGLATIDSDLATITVADPYITTGPASYTATAGQDINHIFSVVAHGTSLKYQWKKNGIKIAGPLGTNTFYNANSNKVMALAYAGTYSVVVSNSVNHLTTSASAVLTVLSPATVTGPATRNIRVPVIEGNNTRFKIVASSAVGSGAVHYQWGAGGVFPNPFIPLTDDSRHIGCTTSTLTILDVQFNDASTLNGYYHCQVSNDSASNVLSAGFNLVVNSNPNTGLGVAIKFIGTNTTSNFVTLKYVKGTNNTPVTVSGVAVDKGRVQSVWLTQTNFDAPSGLGPYVSAITPRINPVTGLPIPTSVLWTNNLVTLVDGTNYIAPHVINENSSILGPKTVDKTATLVYLLEPTTLTLSTNGPGRIFGTPLGLKLGNPTFVTSGGLITNVNVNIGYTVTAQHMLNKTFDGWFTNNVLLSPSPILHFTIPDTNGLSLEARFH